MRRAVDEAPPRQDTCAIRLIWYGGIHPDQRQLKVLTMVAHVHRTHQSTTSKRGRKADRAAGLERNEEENDGPGF